MNLTRRILLFILLTIFLSCSREIHFFHPEHSRIRYQGRMDFADPSQPVLIGSASCVEINFTGDSCIVLLRNMNSPAMYNFVSVEIDGAYQGRVKIAADTMAAYSFVSDSEKAHHRVRIFKSTEASNGTQP
jgi:hypothetical protein